MLNVLTKLNNTAYLPTLFLGALNRNHTFISFRPDATLRQYAVINDLNILLFAFTVNCDQLLKLLR